MLLYLKIFVWSRRREQGGRRGGPRWYIRHFLCVLTPKIHSARRRISPARGRLHRSCANARDRSRGHRSRAQQAMIATAFNELRFECIIIYSRPGALSHGEGAHSHSDAATTFRRICIHGVRLLRTAEINGGSPFLTIDERARAIPTFLVVFRNILVHNIYF